MYKPTEKDYTPEGLTNLLKNYHVMATFLGGLVPGKRSDGSIQVYKAENFFVENVKTTEDIHNLLRSEIFGAPHGIYLEPRNIKKAPPVLFNIFNEDEQKQLKEANLPEEAITLMKNACFDVMDRYKGLGGEDSDNKDKDADNTEGIANQEEYEKYYTQYDALTRNEIADLIVEMGWDTEFKFKPHFSSKSECIKFYILHKHNIKPALTS